MREGLRKGALPWLSASCCAAATWAAADVLITRESFAPASLGPGQTLAWWWAASSYALWTATPLALLGLSAEALGLRLGLRFAAPRLSAGIAALVGAGVTLLGLSQVTGLFQSVRVPEFPDELDDLRVFLSAIVVVAASLSTTLVWAPLLRHPLIARRIDKWLPAVVMTALFGGGLACLAVIHGRLMPVQLDGEVRPLATLALAMMTVAWRIVWRRTHPPTLAALGACALAVMGPGVAAHLPSVQFVLFGHSHGVSMLASSWRDVLDADGDGSSPVWLGGHDCAEFDPERGPLLRERPGDGVDQDCRGGDAVGKSDNGAEPPGDDGQPSAHFSGPHSSPLREWSTRPCIQSSPRRPIVLITVDALRADVFSRGAMPRLRRFSESSSVFERAYAPSTGTYQSLAAMVAGRPLTGLTGAHVLFDRTLRLGDPLASVLREHGFATTLFEFVPLPDVFHSGFAEVNPLQILSDPHVQPAKAQLTAASLVTMALNHWRARPGLSFTWLHFIDVHAPYALPAGMSSASSHREAYEAVVGYVDFQLSRLLEGVERLQPGSIVILTADHGEGLGQHGRQAHGADLFEEVVRIPLIIRHPTCPAERISEPTSLTELRSALLHASHADLPGGTGVEANRSNPGMVVSEVLHRGRAKRALVVGTDKLIVDVQNGGFLAFDLEKDPAETTALRDSRRIASLQQTYQTWLDGPALGGSASVHTDAPSAPKPRSE